MNSWNPREELIRNRDELARLLEALDRKEERTLLHSVDCEWHKATFIDGNLRSIQFAWSDSDAVYIRFRDEQNQFAFDMGPDWQPPPEATTPEQIEKAKYLAIGEVLGWHFNDPEVKFVGHHYAADAVWMNFWLGLTVYQKCVLDTEFAQQTVDEASELGLERGIAMRYTTLGKYDQDLDEWKRDNKSLCEDGYGYIPDEIIIPYAVRDVIAVFRAVPFIRRQMEFQKLVDYYDNIFNPFVTDVFVQFALTGLPMDIPLMDELRELFHYVRRRLEVEFRAEIAQDAQVRTMAKLMQMLGLMDGSQLSREALALRRPVEVEETDPGTGEKVKGTRQVWDAAGAWEMIKERIPLKEISGFKPYFDHLVDSPDFNIRSPDQMRRWLFEVTGMTPVKTTNQKAKGMPSMAWSKVLELPKDRQALYTPAVDKQTLQILAEQLKLVDHLLDLNVVGNLCKAFLKEAETYYDEELDEMVTEEAGLHKWLASDGRVHGQMSTTETGRPRSWKPNSLNWPSFVQDRIKDSMSRVLKADDEAGRCSTGCPGISRMRGRDLPECLAISVVR